MITLYLQNIKIGREQREKNSQMWFSQRNFVLCNNTFSSLSFVRKSIVLKVKQNKKVGLKNYKNDVDIAANTHFGYFHYLSFIAFVRI